MQPERGRKIERPLHPGVQVGPYKLEASLGAGGMGEVFRAADTRLRRTVAIKFLLGQKLADPAERRRFLREARAASALNHPHIVVIYDISSHDGIDFLVMEHVDGQTLKELIPADGMALDRVAKLGAQAASALAAAHAAGIVHRDIKPANIMVTPDGNAKVLDFGVAKIAEQVSDDTKNETLTAVTVPGMVVGTVSYMSPEQMRGEHVDGRSDIFSLGCVLYQAATGRLPFRGRNAPAVMHEIVTAAPASPSSLRSEIPRAFDQLIVACLEKDPARRPASAADVARELQSLSSVPDPVSIRSAGRRSIAVMPFRFRTALPEDQFLSVALAEAVVNRLGATGQLIVRPTTSVLRYAGTDVEWTQVARDLNVDLVVEGTIQKMGPKIRVLVQALQASDSRTLHSFKQDGDAGDLFALQDRIADSVSDVFIPRTKAAAEPAVPPTRNPLAYELYMRAVDRLAHLDRFDTGSAIEMLSHAVELDPNFADAWGRLAEACSQMGSYLDPDPKWFERAEHAIATTLELDPVQCDALCARGQILWSSSRGFQNRAALRAVNAALKVNPSRYNVRRLRGVILFHLGAYARAEQDMEESLLANPAYALAIAARGLIAQYKGDYTAAQELFDQSLRVDSTVFSTHVFAPMVPVLRGRLDEAREKIRSARQIVPEETQLTGTEALIAAHEGDFKLAEQLADDSCSEEKKSMTHSHHTWHCAAGAYAMIGQPEKALAQLRRCAEMGLPNYRLFGSDPHLRALRHLPAFTELMSDLRRRYDQYSSEIAGMPSGQPAGAE
jgi:eukaryotic-like serine/threonine-protein kinase